MTDIRWVSHEWHHGSSRYTPSAYRLNQHGFRCGHSCETHLISVIKQLARNLDSGMQTDLLLLDFSKAFDVAPHKRLLMKLEHYGTKSMLVKSVSTWCVSRRPMMWWKIMCSIILHGTDVSDTGL